MRAQARKIRHDEEEESAFVSMTDMTVGFLFIMMILLAFFASQMRDPDAVSKIEYDRIVDDRDYWRDLAESREQKLVRLISELDDARREKAEMQNRLKNLEAELQVAHSRITDLQLRIQELLKLSARKDAEIAELERRIAKLQQVDPLEAYLAQVATARREVLTRLRDAIRIDFPDLRVELSEESDALRFQGEGLFASGRSTLVPTRRAIVARLAQRLDEVLPCFALGKATRFEVSCNPGLVMIEAVQIEGHTDDRGTDTVNRNLSAARANNTFFAMTQAAGSIIQHTNLKGQPVLSVAAYGPDRPVTSNDTVEGRATNRRIDLRFIMVTPQDTDGIEVIREALEEAGAEP